jgi:8-oxo-dGTP pyrophosphatase MutT (NUDIX family)
MTEHRQRRPGEWITHSTIKEVYSSWWMTLRIDDVERPDGSHTAHEVVRGPDAAGIVVLSPSRGALMIWRHRFMPDTWGWEIPGGAIEPGERPEEAARRECLEETGWRVVGPTRHLSTHHPSVGLVNQTFHVYFASAAEYVGKPSDSNEAADVAWLPIEQVVDALSSGSITDAFTQLGVTLALARAGYGRLFAESAWQTATEGPSADHTP